MGVCVCVVVVVGWGGVKLQRQGPGSVCSDNASLHRTTRALRARLFKR